MLLADLVSDPRTEEELRWFWCDSEGALGARSNFNAMRTVIMLGIQTGSTPAFDIDERTVIAATRARRIRRSLENLEKGDVTILEHAFGTGTRETKAFGQATGVVPLTKAAITAWSASSTHRALGDWLSRLVRRAELRAGSDRAQDRVLVAAIREEAVALLDHALRAYAAARRRTRTSRGRRARPSELSPTGTRHAAYQ